LDNFLKAQANLEEREFNSLESRANIILDAGGYPEKIVGEMDSILQRHKDPHGSEKHEWEVKIKAIRSKMDSLRNKSKIRK